MIITDDNRFWAKVNRLGPSDCWLWTACKTAQGYGLYGYKGRNLLAHRYVLGLLEGEGPRRQRCVLHTCDTPTCVNPAHLRVGTYYENMQDAAQKGRIARGERNGGGGKLTESQVLEIRARFERGEAQRALARAFTVSPRMIHFIVMRKNWKHV